MTPKRLATTAGLSMAALIPALVWALLTPGTTAPEPIRSQAQLMAVLRFFLALSFMIFFIYEYTYAIQIYSSRAQPDPDQIIKKLELLKRRERLTAFRWLVLGILCFCAFPLFDYKPEENARWTKVCQQNVSKLSSALVQYYKAKGSYPPAYLADASGKPMHSWRVLILPYLDQDALHGQYNFAEPWNSPHNAALASKVPDVFLCPVRNPAYASLLTQWIWPSLVDSHSNYAMLTGPGTAFKRDKGPTKTDFADGVDRTLIFVEHAGVHGNWLKPGNISCTEFSSLPASELTMHFTPGNIFHACFANGTINPLSSTISATERNELAQAADGLPRKTFGRY